MKLYLLFFVFLTTNGAELPLLCIDITQKIFIYSLLNNKDVYRKFSHLLFTHQKSPYTECPPCVIPLAETCITYYQFFKQSMKQVITTYLEYALVKILHHSFTRKFDYLDYYPQLSHLIEPLSFHSMITYYVKKEKIFIHEYETARTALKEHNFYNLTTEQEILGKMFRINNYNTYVYRCSYFIFEKLKNLTLCKKFNFQQSWDTRTIKAYIKKKKEKSRKNSDTTFFLLLVQKLKEYKADPLMHSKIIMNAIYLINEQNIYPDEFENSSYSQKVNSLTENFWIFLQKQISYSYGKDLLQMKSLKHIFFRSLYHTIYRHHNYLKKVDAIYGLFPFPTISNNNNLSLDRATLIIFNFIEKYKHYNISKTINYMAKHPHTLQHITTLTINGKYVSYRKDFLTFISIIRVLPLLEKIQYQENDFLTQNVLKDGTVVTSPHPIPFLELIDAHKENKLLQLKLHVPKEKIYDYKSKFSCYNKDVISYYMNKKCIYSSILPLFNTEHHLQETYLRLYHQNTYFRKIYIPISQFIAFGAVLFHLSPYTLSWIFFFINGTTRCPYWTFVAISSELMTKENCYPFYKMITRLLWYTFFIKNFWHAITSKGSFPQILICSAFLARAYVEYQLKGESTFLLPLFKTVSQCLSNRSFVLPWVKIEANNK